MRKKRHIFSGLAFGGLCMASMAIAGAAVSSDPVSSEASVSPELYGAVIASDNPEFSDWGIYRVPVAGNGDFIRVATGSEGLGRGSGVATSDTYISVRYFAFYGMEYVQAYFYDLETWAEEPAMKVIDRDLMAYDLAYDPVSERVYGCFYSKDSDTDCWFGIADYRNGMRTSIAKVEKWNALSFDMEGNAYAVDMQGNLLKVDKETGATSQVGFTGVVPRYPTSGTIDPKTGLLYWTVCPEEGHSYLYTVNLETAEASLVTQYEHDQQITGLYIPLPDADENAPAAVSDLALDFPRGSLVGNVTFTAPSQTYGGGPLSGTLQWSLTGEGVPELKGTAEAGNKVTVPVTVDAPGEYEFRVITSNSAGNSPKARASMFIGDGIPSSTTASAAWADGKVTVSWLPVTESTDGGWLDPEEVVYKVKRLPDGAVLAEACGECSLVADLPEPTVITTYQFEVTPVFNGRAGESCLTPKITLGSVIPPYEESFDSAESLDMYTMIDANEDSKCWGFSSDGSVRLFYSSGKNADDWLITPPVRLEAGSQYTVSFDVRNSYGESYPERIEVKAGRSPEAVAMTESLLDPVIVDFDSWRSVNMTIVAEETGVYYIGIHGISDPDMFWVGIDNLRIDAGVSMKSPAAPSDLKAIADRDGGNEVEISFTAPEKTLDGETLGEITRINIWRDNEPDPVGNIGKTTPGTTVTWKENNVSEGKHEYTVRAYNEYGIGAPASASTFVGINVPSKVTDVDIRESSPGYATITWKAPETDRDGNPINPAFISYNITDMYGEPVKTGVTELSYTTQVVRQEEQDFILAGIEAVTSAGKSAPVFTNMIPVGKPYDTPYRDSFGEGDEFIKGLTRISGNTSWKFADDMSVIGVESQDKDNAYIMMNASYPGDIGAMYTGKISLADCSKPSLALYVYQFVSEDGTKDDANTLDIEVREAGAEDYTTLCTVVNNTLPEAGWNRLLVSLEDFVGKTIQIRLKVSVTSLYVVYAIDNMTVGDIPDNNLAVLSASAPAVVDPDTDFNVTAAVANTGLNDSGKFVLNLMCDGEIIDTREASGIAAGDVEQIAFTTRLPFTQTDPVRYSFSLEWNEDQNPADNEAESDPVVVEFADLPVAGGLSGMRVGDNIELKWDAVDLSQVENTPVTDSFEDYRPFSMNPGGDWKFTDADGGQTFVPQSVDIEGLGADSAYAFIVMDATHPNFNGSFAAHTGDRYIGAFYCNDYSTQNDDWAITPRLSGEAQTISFFARNYNSTYGKETFEVRYSTTGTEVEDFTETVLTMTLEGNEWTEISVELPDGAVYAAIHYISDNQYMFFVDDFTYMPAPWNERVTHVGYNIYRDGKRINETPVTDAQYLDRGIGADGHSYNVTAVYDCGESAPSAELYIKPSGIGDISHGIRIFTVDNNICVAGAEGLEVGIASVSGMTVAYVADAADFVKVAVEPGVYIVRIAGRTFKLIVK